MFEDPAITGFPVVYNSDLTYSAGFVRSGRFAQYYFRDHHDSYLFNKATLRTFRLNADATAAPPAGAAGAGGAPATGSAGTGGDSAGTAGAPPAMGTAGMGGA